jgi:hypothetical protein
MVDNEVQVVYDLERAQWKASVLIFYHGYTVLTEFGDTLDDTIKAITKTVNMEKGLHDINS